MKKIHLAFFLCFTFLKPLQAQDTFSILAFDSISGEVGGAGASCLDLFSFPGYTNDFIIELFPGVGAIASQASYIAANQQNARARMNLGQSPKQIISWLQANDVQNNASVRQYGVVRMMHDSVKAAAFTGTGCMDYKNHIVGPNYTIQGNILLGQKVLDSMEARFLREPGDLACKLMAAMQGANMIAADSRCSFNQTSSLFGFLKVTRPGDTFGNPYFLISLKTHGNDAIEPIDSLQRMFDAARTCTYSTVGLKTAQKPSVNSIRVFPNPASEEFTIQAATSDAANFSLYNLLGEVIRNGQFRSKQAIYTKDLNPGLYLLKVEVAGEVVLRKVLIQ